MAYDALTGADTVADLIERTNALSADYTEVNKLNGKGLNGPGIVSTAGPDTYVLGSVTTFYGTETECVAVGLPAIPRAQGPEVRQWTVSTFGQPAAKVQIATELLSEGLLEADWVSQFKRSYNGTTYSPWVPVGSGGGAKAGVFYEGDIVVVNNYEITSGKNAMSAGPVEIQNGITIDIPTGSTWTIV